MNLYLDYQLAAEYLEKELFIEISDPLVSCFDCLFTASTALFTFICEFLTESSSKSSTKIIALISNWSFSSIMKRLI